MHAEMQLVLMHFYIRHAAWGGGHFIKDLQHGVANYEKGLFFFQTSPVLETAYLDCTPCFKAV